ncbi:MAG: DASH family cryptochrome [Marinilabiliaceae bacterium]|nr:DASH family cryptochrome [Marinilabiliaceae bacterium]
MNTSIPLIFWFRNDLRLHDNAALAVAMALGCPVLAVYVLDDQLMTPSALGFTRAGAHRLNFLKASVLAFRRQLRDRGGELHVFEGDPVAVLSRLSTYYSGATVVAHHEYAHDELVAEQRLSQWVPLQLVWGNMLFAPGTIPLDAAASPFYYTAFKNKVTAMKRNFVESPWPDSVRWLAVDADNLPLPGADVSGWPVTIDRFPVGEEAALQLLDNYATSPRMAAYAETREWFEGQGHSTALSPYLATGALSPIRVLNVISAQPILGDEMQLSVSKLTEQLIWRDYYRWLFLRYGKTIFRRTGLRKVVPPMFDDLEAFEMWRNGHTTHPLINALMNELAATGWMSNRGRMIAAYYLSKELKVNWLWGAQWFEAQLIDYDVCNNYGNWAYQSGTGTDSRINRRFNLDKQMLKFDAQRIYVNKWV